MMLASGMATDTTRLDPPRSATSYDVALRAGVSQSAVSRCFRDGGSLSAEKRARIEAAARALGYAPNKIARSLITQRSNIIGVLVAESTTRFYPDLLLKLGQAIQAAGRSMLVFTASGLTGAAAALADILAYHVDGLISGVSLPDDMLRVCANRRIPVVLYNRASRDGWSSSVGCDDPAALALMAAHLRAGGSRRIDFIAGPAEAPVSQSRLRAMREAAREHGLVLSRVVHADYSHEGGRQAALGLLAAGRPPDTIMCANDAMALGAIDACRHGLHRAVPQEIAIAGFDNVPEGAWPPYGLTTLAQPLEALTAAAVRMIGEQLDGIGGHGEQRRMAATLVIRSSTRPPRAKPGIV